MLTLTLALDTKIISNDAGNTAQKGFFGKRTSEPGNADFQIANVDSEKLVYIQSCKATMRLSTMTLCSFLGWRHVLGEGSDEVARGVVVGHNDQFAGSCASAGRAQLCAGLPDDLREMTRAKAARLAAELVLLDLAVP